MADFTEEQIGFAWQKASEVPNNDPDVYRKDVAGAWIRKDQYGKESDYGWTVDHIYPEAKGGDEDLINLRALHWKNNIRKSDDYPSYYTAVSSEGNKNVEKEQGITVNPQLQTQLGNLYDSQS